MVDMIVDIIVVGALLVIVVQLNMIREISQYGIPKFRWDYKITSLKQDTLNYRSLDGLGHDCWEIASIYTYDDEVMIVSKKPRLL